MCDACWRIVYETPYYQKLRCVVWDLFLRSCWLQRRGGKTIWTLYSEGNLFSTSVIANCAGAHQFSWGTLVPWTLCLMYRNVMRRDLMLLPGRDDRMSANSCDSEERSRQYCAQISVLFFEWTTSCRLIFSQCRSLRAVPQSMMCPRRRLILATPRMHIKNNIMSRSSVPPDQAVPTLVTVSR